ncbi:16819_t:CDS:2 [Entrophospora sp. SA101]|nr:16819_t:CDS:2 [Entrophospora sp. SA101]
MDTNSAQTKTITQDQIINPWNVNGAVVDGKQQAIDYDKLIEQFGTKRIDKDLLERFETLTGKKCHIFLRRGVFFSHRELGMILDRYEKKKPFFLYTGRVSTALPISPTPKFLCLNEPPVIYKK